MCFSITASFLLNICFVRIEFDGTDGVETVKPIMFLLIKTKSFFFHISKFHILSKP